MGSLILLISPALILRDSRPNLLTGKVLKPKPLLGTTWVPLRGGMNHGSLLSRVIEHQPTLFNIFEEKKKKKKELINLGMQLERNKGGKMTLRAKLFKARKLKLEKSNLSFGGRMFTEVEGIKG